MEEEWRDIQGYEGLYQVSNLGRIKSFDAYDTRGRLRHGKILKPNKKQITGYLRVQLCFGKPKSFLVSRLVAKAFPEICGEWFEGCEVDHINGNKEDNRAENLYVCTHAENLENPNTKKQNLERGKKTGIKVDQFDLSGNKIKTWNSFKEIKRELGYWLTTIKKCCRGQSKSSYGFCWKFASQKEIDTNQYYYTDVA